MRFTLTNTTTTTEAGKTYAIVTLKTLAMPSKEIRSAARGEIGTPAFDLAPLYALEGQEVEINIEAPRG